MNNSRRALLKKILYVKNIPLQYITNELLSNYITKVQDVLDEEQESFDNLPENLQGGIRACEMEEAIANLEEAIDFLEDAKDATSPEDREINLYTAIDILEEVAY